MRGESQKKRYSINTDRKGLQGVRDENGDEYRDRLRKAGDAEASETGQDGSDFEGNADANPHQSGDRQYDCKL